MTLVLAELAPANPSVDAPIISEPFVSDPYKEIMALLDGENSQVSGVGSGFNLAIASTSLPSETIRERANSYPYRIAIGAKDAWDIFPEYRKEFCGTIERKTLQGIARGEIRLADTLVDDKLVGLRLKLFSQRTYSALPKGSGIEFDEFVIDEKQLRPYEYLAGEEPCEDISVHNKFLFFCNYFSVRGDMGKDIIPGVKFFSPHALHAHTDFDDLWRAQHSNHAPAGFSPKLAEMLPDRFSGVLALDSQDQAYNEILVRRILAAAAFAGTAYGKVFGSVMLTKNSSTASRVTEFGTRPYCDHSLPEKNIISSENEIFRKILELVGCGTPEKFEKGKEDYRLLAIDVVEDARRSSVPTLAYAQLWMAIEKLIAIRQEISAQISLALSAFSPAAERPDIFEKLKKGYSLRSNIVHGYSFKPSEFQDCPAHDVARLFRLLFLAALKYPKSDKLYAALWRHVLSGAPTPFSPNE